MKEIINIMSPELIQQKLWGRTIQEKGLQKRVDQAKKGWLPKGRTLVDFSKGENPLSLITGNFSSKVLIATSPEDTNLELPCNTAALGGWCALRTHDFTLLSQGKLTDLLTGAESPITSVSDAAAWIENAVSFDQITESIGAVNVSEYTVISERKLWSMRIVGKLETLLNQKLSLSDQSLIEKAVEKAELKRAAMTKKYLELTTTGTVKNFKRVVDEDVWDGLKSARDALLGNAGLTTSTLKELFPKEQSSIDSLSMVWGMYAEPYVDMLRGNGYLTSQKAYIVEPAHHSYIETRAEKLLTDTIFHKKGVYLDKNGINENTGFIGYLESVGGNGQDTRRERNISQVPNIKNFRDIFEKDNLLCPMKNAVINPSDNELFIWALNLFPFGETLSDLLSLAEIQERFKKEKANLNALYVTLDPQNLSRRPDIQSKVESLKEELIDETFVINTKIASQLTSVFNELIMEEHL